MSRAWRPALLAAAGVAAITVGLLLARPSVHRAAPRVLPDVGGRIILAAATASSARRSPLRNASIITELGRTLPDRIELLLLTNDRAAFTLMSHERRVRFVELPAEVPLTIWPQDPFLVLRLPGGEHALLASRDFERAEDREMARALATELGWELRSSPLYFEGGNIASDESVIFLGADTVVRNVVDLELEPAEIVHRFEELLGAPVVVLGPSPQPIAHIDLAFTPLGGGRVVVADARWGADLVSASLNDTPEIAAQFEERTRAFFFGHPEIERLLLADGSELEAPDLAQQTRLAVDASLGVAPLLDGIAEGLRSQGYQVERVPLLVGAKPPNGDSGPGYPMLSYNNVLLESLEGEERVYLPRYGFAPLDDAATSAWQSFGFEVVVIDGLATSAMYGGALRCAVKVLARE